ncbi:hypothetical protein ACHAXT_006005 [Thalassiosira profunda]
MTRLLLLAAGLACTTAPSAGGIAPPSSPPDVPPSDLMSTLDAARILQSDDALATIQKLEDGALSVRPHCYVSAPSVDDILVWCDIYLPFGLETKAEIKEGNCEEFTDVAVGDTYLLGVASPVFYPEISDEEKRRGTFDHSYCARMDVFHDASETGEAVSVLERRYPMEVSYNFTGEVEEEITASLADFSIFFGDAIEGADVEGEQIEKRPPSDTSGEEDTGGGNNTGMYIGLSVAAGVAIIVALAAIVWGRRRMRRSQGEAGGTQGGEEEESTRRVFEEWMRRSAPGEVGDAPPEKIITNTKPAMAPSPARTARSLSSMSGGNEQGEELEWIGDVESFH